MKEIASPVASKQTQGNKEFRNFYYFEEKTVYNWLIGYGTAYRAALARTEEIFNEIAAEVAICIVGIDVEGERNNGVSDSKLAFILCTISNLERELGANWVGNPAQSCRAQITQPLMQ